MDGMVAGLVALEPQDLEVGRPSPFRIYDEGGRLMLDRGEAIASQELAQLLLACRAKRDPVPEEAAPQRAETAPASARPGQVAAHRLFRAMGLRPGDRLQLELPGPLGARRAVVRVIGYQEGRALLVTPPFQEGSCVPLLEGERVRARLFTGRQAYGFESFVDRACLQGLDYLQLSFPTHIHVVNVRKALRVKTCTVASLRPTDAETAMPPTAALIVDLSTSGAGLVACRAIAGKEDRVTLSFTLRMEEASTAIETRAFVRSVNPDPATGGFRLGLQFDRLEDLQYLALKAYVLERLYEDPSSLV